ncbi:hypothetical protein PanWU01x14_348430 [Parasponia andersonii]|uniref:Retrotransposon gag domain-containing protein n=1 Tax=Parasponia andersonii TaxID=3476 RepID=A0A2P5ABN9_PARAD|nr:hypothetical protein PanWU01x14_348430 [Parasponia andersonii]
MRRRGQPRTQQERHEDRISKGKGKVANLPPESSTESSSTNRDRVQPSRKSTNSQDRLSGKQRRPSRSVFERISKESRQDPADLRQYLERRRSHDRSVSHHNDQSRSRRTISLDSSHRSQKTLPNQPAMKQDNERRPPVPPARDDAFPLNVDVHNLRIALDALAGWDDELTDGYRQSPFSEEVRAAALPTGFRLPTINTFDGKTDPQDHMDHFSDLMELHRVSDHARCRCFTVTLSGAVKKWFRGLKSGLSAIRQGPEETLRSYLNRFTSELAKINNPPEGGVLTLMMARVRPETKLWEELLERECRTLEDFYQRVGRHLRLESSSENLQKTKKGGRTDATKDAVITNNSVTNQKERFRQPEPMKRDRTMRDPNKHDTNNCFALKDEIERLIREGRLRQYTRQSDERREEDQQQPPEIQREVQTIFGGPHVGGDSKRAQDRYGREARQQPLNNVMHLEQ